MPPLGKRRVFNETVSARARLRPLDCDDLFRVPVASLGDPQGHTPAAAQLCLFSGLSLFPGSTAVCNCSMAALPFLFLELLRRLDSGNMLIGSGALRHLPARLQSF